MAKQSSLLNFFSKGKPNTNSPIQTCKPDKKKKNALIINGKEFKHLDLVWAKMESYPWWPAILYEHPIEKKLVRNKNVHVQFFENPPSRGWVKRSFIKNYEDPSKLSIPTYNDPLWLEAKAEADAVINLPRSERAALIVEMIPSDEEDDNDNQNHSMEAGNSDESKENVDANIGHSSKKRSLDKKEEPKTKKRRIVLVSDSDLSEDEYKPNVREESDDDDDDDDDYASDLSASSIVLQADDNSEPETEPEITPVKATPKRKAPVSNMNGTNKKLLLTPSTPKVSNSTPSTPKVSISDFGSPKTPVVSSATKSKLASFAAVKETPTKAPSDDVVNYPHTKIVWLKPESIRDSQKRRPEDPEFNPRTLHVPEDFLNKQTPAMRQWWVLKAQHYDTVLFFKMGKFYELFHMDAILSVEELGLLMMRGDNAHTGFPEKSYGRYSSRLIEKGFKIARVEQTETPDMMEKRVKKSSKTTKFDKVVNREICQVSSLGTRVPSVMDGDIRETNATFLLAVTERGIEGPGENRTLGVAFINTTIGKFHIGQFSDDRHLSRLRTLIAHHPPAQILYEKGRLSSGAQQLMKGSVPAGLLEVLNSEKEFWTASKTLSFLSQSDHFKVDDVTQWPEPLKKMMSEEDSVLLTANSEFDLGVSCFGALIWYLTLCMLEQDLLTRRMVDIYVPPDQDVDTSDSQTNFLSKRMVMDGTTLRNLEVFENSSNESAEGTLFETLNHCQTPFGKRLLHNWLCSPLCNSEAINSRLDAIEDLKENQDVVATVKPLLKELPDLEKLLSKIHSQGLKRSEDHPDTRAILFEIKIFSQRKVIDFLSAINGFKATVTIMDWFNECRPSLKSKLLSKCVTSKELDGNFPSLKQPLKFFDGSFDHNLAKQEGKIIPSEGVDPEYDQACQTIKDTKNKLDDYLKEQTKYFGAKVNYFGSEKKRFQLEVNDNASKKADDSYELVTQRKGFKRFWTETTKELLKDMMEAEDNREMALRDIARRIFKQFDEHIDDWNNALECISVLDVLLSLTEYAMQVESCRPQVIPPSSDIEPCIEIREGRHPCSIKIFSGGDYIPNDVVIGCSQDPESHKRLVLVTGPNMGGKSTLMRQTALICLMAQVGSYVPAADCRLTAVDRIFTRLGAQDKIFEGESTFYVEMAETASIIKHATPHSLVIVDELGRGTATYDGTAIAFAVVEALTRLECRTLFSTHYHSLVDDFKDSRVISQGHMACMVENDNEEDPSQETITFLYKFAHGSCPKSYGFNAARLASLPEEIIRCATEKAKEFETQNNRKKNFRLLFGQNEVKDMNNYRDLIKGIRQL